MDSLIEKIKNKYGDNLLLIGLRGSNALGIHSDDIDLLVVLKENHNDIKQDDIQIVSWDSFLKYYIEGTLEIAEAIHNIVYMNEHIGDHIDMLVNNAEMKNNFDKALKTECFLAIKNQLKIAKKFPEHYNKCVSKAKLFYDIINSEYAASNIWDNNNDTGKELIINYINNRNNGYDNNELYDFLWEYRNDKTIRSRMMISKNEAHVVLKEKVKLLTTI